jgi:hypothetical protein
LEVTASTSSRRREEEEDEEGGKLAMVDSASITSEDVQVTEDVRSRPCEFIAPPPPVEPPPDYEDEAGRLFVDKGTELGEDNTSLAPASLKSSPVLSEYCPACIFHFKPLPKLPIHFNLSLRVVFLFLFLFRCTSHYPYMMLYFGLHIIIRSYVVLNCLS